MKIYLTGKQIRGMANFALGISIPDTDSDDSNYCLETDVVVDGETEDLFIYDTDYPEEGGCILSEENEISGP